jgi:hypothetical protein
MGNSKANQTLSEALANTRAIVATYRASWIARTLLGSKVRASVSEARAEVLRSADISKLHLTDCLTEANRVYSRLAR